MAKQGTITSISLLSIWIIVMMLLIEIQCQYEQQQRGGKQMAPGVNTNNKYLNNIQTQKNGNTRPRLGNLTPAQKEQIKQKQFEAKELAAIEGKNEINGVEEVKITFNEEPKIFQSKVPSDCKDDESFSHYKLDKKKAVPDFLLMSSSMRYSTRPQALARILGLHEAIAVPRVVEPHFFSYPWITKINPFSYQSIYSNLYNQTDKRELKGDFSSTYLFHPLAPRRIASQFPDMKIIIILTDPITRAYNNYLDRFNDGLENLSFEQLTTREFKEVQTLRKSFRSCYNELECDKNACVPRGTIFYAHDVEQTPHELRNESDLKDYLITSYLFRSIYDDMVERWLNAFDRENLLVISQDSFDLDKSGVLNRILEFLELPNREFTDEELEEEEILEVMEVDVDHRISTPLSMRSRSVLCKYFSNYNNRLFRMIGEEFEWKKNCEKIDQLLAQYEIFN